MKGIFLENESRKKVGTIQNRFRESWLVWRPAHQNKTHNAFYACHFLGGRPSQETVKFPIFGRSNAITAVKGRKLSLTYFWYVWQRTKVARSCSIFFVRWSQRHFRRVEMQRFDWLTGNTSRQINNPVLTVSSAVDSLPPGALIYSRSLL